MSTELEKPKQTLKDYVFSEETKRKFESLLKDNPATFLTSIVQIANSNDMLKKAEPSSIINAALTAATLNLPLNNNLGFAWIVPYQDKAQFQIGWKGFVQLAQRSGLFKSIYATPIYEGQITNNNPLEGYEFDFSVKPTGAPIGYAARFKLLNGFQSTMYMSTEDVERHAKKYSQTYKKGFGVWKDNFDAMAKKTVIKLLISQYAPLSINMQTALLADQAIIKQDEEGTFQYLDNEPEKVDKELERFALLIQDASTLDDIEALKKHVPDVLLDDLLMKEQKLRNGGK